jgi:uncharacterized protein with HEPN domain
MPRYTREQCLADMLQSIEAAQEYVANLSSDEFVENQQLVDAVVYRLQCASEAARRLNQHWPEVFEELSTRYPEVKWREMRGFSDIARHGYDLLEPWTIFDQLQPGGAIAQTAVALRAEIR